MTRAVALLLTLFTGFTGLVYQVTWQKYLATLLGSHSEATAAVLGIFLGGLSLGYSLFGVVTTRLMARVAGSESPPRLLLCYGAIEGAIGVYALIFPLLFRAAQSVSFVLPHENPALGFFLDVLLSALLIGPPAVLMGATIPILTQALSRTLDDATRFHAFVYGLNTVGAFAGALAAGFYLIPRFGLDGALLAMGLLNLFAGAVYAGIDLVARPHAIADFDERPEETETTGDAVRGAWIYLLAALLIGFAMMTLETTLIRLASLAFGSSQFTFSMVVAAFVLCIALGGLSVSGLSRVPKIYLAINLWVLVGLLTLLYFFLYQAPYWVYAMRTAFSNLDVAFHFFYLSGFGLLLLVIGVPVFLSGVTLPLIFHHLRNEFGELGSLAGRLYSWNTVGSLLGALIGGYALFFWFDLHHIYRFTVAAVVVSAVLLTVRLFDLRMAAVAAALPLLLLLAGMPPWDPMILQAGLFRETETPPELYQGYEAYVEKQLNPPADFLLTYEDDPTASIAVRNLPHTDGRSSLSIIVNGKSDGNTIGDYQTMALASVLSALMADKIERSFVIGWGTGVTVGELASLDGAKEITVAEISSGVIRAADLFEEYNLHASTRPNVRLIRSDAYRALTRSESDFDLIISEPSNPWVTGVEMLFSREFLQLSHDRLAPGGVYAQWYHKYETDDESLELVLRTFGSVFEYTSVWEATPMDLIIIGFKSVGPAVDYLRMVERTQRPDYRASLQRSGIPGTAALLAKEFVPVGVLSERESTGPLHSLYQPILSHIAGRAFFRRDRAHLPFTGYGEPARIGSKNSILRRYIEYRGPKFDEAERTAAIFQATQQTRGFGVTMVANWLNESPDSEAFESSYARATQWLRATRPEEDPKLVIEKLAGLYKGSPFTPETTTPELAQELTDLYVDFYYHAYPFDPEVLTAAWTNCRDIRKNEEQCRAEVPEGSERYVQLLAQGPDAIDQYVAACQEKTFEGAACREGVKETRRLLEVGR